MRKYTRLSPHIAWINSISLSGAEEPGNEAILCGPAFGLASFPGSCVPGTRAWEWACFWSGLVPRFLCAQYKSLGMGLLLVWQCITEVDLFCVVLFPRLFTCANACGIASLVPGWGRG